MESRWLDTDRCENVGARIKGFADELEIRQVGPSHVRCGAWVIGLAASREQLSVGVDYVHLLTQVEGNSYHVVIEDECGSHGKDGDDWS